MNFSGEIDEREIAQLRLNRLERSLGGSVLIAGAWPAKLPLIAVTCSRLGLDPRLHRHVCRFLTRTMIDCRQRGGVVLIADGSAIDPWATRAAELFGVSVIRLFVNEVPSHLADEKHLFLRSVNQTKLCRDHVVIALADRVDAIHVRRGGKIFSAIRQRLRDRDDVTTRVAISSAKNQAALSLINEGAIGWFCSSSASKPAPNDFPEQSLADSAADESLDWARTDGQWLIHSTRACVGPWPGETQRQYRDAMLLSDESVINRGPLDALTRIVRQRKLIGAAVATDHRFRVVCFSAASLREHLRSRCYRQHLKRWDCEPFGVAIRMTAARRLGAQSVVYGKGDDRKRLATDDQYRFQAAGKTFDWTSEREWRVLGDVDLAACEPHDVRVFVPTETEARTIAGSGLSACPWKISCVAPLSRSDAIIR